LGDQGGHDVYREQVRLWLGLDEGAGNSISKIGPSSKREVLQRS
jgi:hypothetical protein